jgi:hypothetical protein
MSDAVRLFVGASAQNERRDAYVYAIVVDGVTRYIGKGSGDRLVYHMTIARRVLRTGSEGNPRGTTRLLYRELAAALARGAQVQLRKIREGLTSHEALSVERDVIASAKTDRLWNMRAGGAGGSPSLAVRQQIAESVRKSWASPDRRLVSNTVRGRISKSLKLVQSWAEPGIRAKRIAAMHKAGADPMNKARKSEAMRLRHATRRAAQ